MKVLRLPGSCRGLSVFLILVLLLRIVPLLDFIGNFEAFRETILNKEVSAVAAFDPVRKTVGIRFLHGQVQFQQIPNLSQLLPRATTSGSEQKLSAPLPMRDRRFITIRWWRACGRQSMQPACVGKLQKIDASVRGPFGGYAHVDFGLWRRGRNLGVACLGVFRLKAASSCTGSSRRLLSCFSSPSHLPRRTSAA